MRVKPKEGLVIRFPVKPYRKLPPEGAQVPDGDTYWMRRLQDGDVVRVDEEETP